MIYLVNRVLSGAGMKFFLKNGILKAKVYTKNVSYIEECNFIPAPLRTLITKQVIEVLY